MLVDLKPGVANPNSRLGLSDNKVVTMKRRVAEWPRGVHLNQKCEYRLVPRLIVMFAHFYVTTTSCNLQFLEYVNY